MSFVTLILMLLLAGCLVSAATVYLMARGLLRPPRMTDGKALHVLNRLTPRDLDLPYENCAFEVRDEQTGKNLRLAAWWIPARGGEDGGSRVEDRAIAAEPRRDNPRPSSRTVILIHGYADAKVGGIAWAPLWHEIGFNVLALDLRAHGESDGTICSGGFHERHDLVAVVHELLAHRPLETRTLVLFGASMGAAAAAGAAEILAAAGHPPLVHGLVLDSPFVSFRTACLAHFQRLGLPGGAVASAALRLAEWISNSDFGQINLINVVPRIGCPIIIVAPAADGYLSADDADALQRAMENRGAEAGPGEVVHFDGAGHLMAAVTEPQRYRQMLADFASAILRHGAADSAEPPTPVGQERPL